MRRIKTNYKPKKLKTSTIITLVFLLICFFSFHIFKEFNENVTPKLIEIASKSIDKYTYNLLNNYSLVSKIDNNTVNQMLKIAKNEEDEIISVDYNLQKAYEITNLIVKEIKDNYNKIENGKLNIEYYDEDLSNGIDGFVISLPIGLASNQVFLSNLGPRIPVKIKFIGTVLTNLKTRVKDYGINNALIELYIDLSITHEIITPVTFQNKEFKYEFLIDAKVINGTVPSYYGGLIETKSNILNIPNN